MRGFSRPDQVGQHDFHAPCETRPKSGAEDARSPDDDAPAEGHSAFAKRLECGVFTTALRASDRMSARFETAMRTLRLLMNHTHIVTSLLLAASLSGCATREPRPGPESAPGPYRSDWTSLNTHSTPRWLRNAKFGIYCHWGIWTLQYQPEHADKSNDVLIALWKGDRFKADEWAALFDTAGARFGGVIGWHGSDFKHWDSDLSDYNSAKMGPRIDVVGEVARAVRERGLKFLVSYHSIGDDDWIDFAREGVNKYSPDIFWVDASFGGTKGAQHARAIRQTRYIGEHTKPLKMFGEGYQREFIAHFFNHAHGRGQEVEFVYKSHDVPPGVGMRDLENGLLPDIAYDTWMTDMDMSVPPDWETHGWFHREGVRLRSADELVDMLVDVVSKNGILLLNVPPLADGSFSDEVQSTLGELGAWLRANGDRDSPGQLHPSSQQSLCPDRLYGG